MKNIKKKIKRLFYLRVAVLMAFFLGLCLAFSPLQVQAARLLGVTGDGADTPETLFVLDQGNASSTFVMSLGNGDDGETIAFNPVDGFLYHLSGFSSKIFEFIDLNSLVITDIPLILPLPTSLEFAEAVAATYNPFNTSTDEFLVAYSNKSLYSVTSSGTVTLIGEIKDSLGDKIFLKGLAFVGSTLYSVSKDDAILRTIDPGTGAVTDDSVEITLDGVPPKGANGLATTHPDTGVLWAVLKLGGSTGVPGERRLVTINPDTGIATDIGLVGDAFAGIAFDITTEFSALTLKKTMVKFRHILNNDEIVVDDEFMLKGKFVLGEPNNDIDPVNEEVIVKVGTSTIEIPQGSFVLEDGKFKFEGTIGDAYVRMKIQWIHDNTFKFKIMARGVDLTGTSNPVLVGLDIGNDIGQSSIRLKGLLFKHKHKHNH